MNDNTIIEDFTKAFGQFNNAIHFNFGQIESILKDSNLDQSSRDKIIQASATMKESIKNQDPNKIFEALKEFQK